MSSSIALRRSPKPGSLDRADIQRAAQFVHNQRRQSFAFDIFGDDQQWLARTWRSARERHQSFIC